MSIKAPYLKFAIGTAIGTVAATALLGTAPAAAAAPCDKLRIQNVNKHECALTLSRDLVPPGTIVLSEPSERSSKIPKIGETPQALSPRVPTTSADTAADAAAGSGRLAEAKGSHK